MTRRLVIFGTGDIAQLAHYYFGKDPRFEIVAFTVDAAYVREPSFCGLPVIPFEEVAGRYPPDKYEMFVALSYAKLNAVRKDKYLETKAKGYRIASYVSRQATVLNDDHIGENCFILEDNTIQPFARIGNNVTLWSGNHIGHHSIISDHCFLASHIVVSGGVEIGDHCFLGVNATLRDGIHVAERCLIGAGAVVMKDTQPGEVYAATATEPGRVPSSRIRV